MIDLEEHPDGIVVPVLARPGGRVNGVAGVHAGALRVNVTQVAERGRANHAIRDVLADALGLRRSQIELLSGPSSRFKRFLICGMAMDELQTTLARIT